MNNSPIKNTQIRPEARKDIIDKKGILNRAGPNNIIEIELGTGTSKRNKNAFGIDVIDSDAVDIVGDALIVLRKLPGESVRLIRSEHMFEHLLSIREILVEITRVLVPGGKLVVIVPHFSNPLYYSDPTHKTFFGLYTFSYFCKDNIFKRRVPRYAAIEGLELESVRLIFKTFRPRYITYAFRKLMQIVFNSTNYLKETYEDSFSNLVSCYEIEYCLKKEFLVRDSVR